MIRENMGEIVEEMDGVFISWYNFLKIAFTEHLYGP